jgi:hypothetical protein
MASISGVPEVVKFPVLGSNPPWGVTISRSEVEHVIQMASGDSACSWSPRAVLPAAVACKDGLLFAMSFVYEGTTIGFVVAYYKMKASEIRSVDQWTRTGKTSLTMDEELDRLSRVEGAQVPS